MKLRKMMLQCSSKKIPGIKDNFPDFFILRGDTYDLGAVKMYPYP